MATFIILIVLAAICANALLGACVLATIDRDGRLFDWYKCAPHESMKWAVLEFWPVVVIAYFWFGHNHRVTK